MKGMILILLFCFVFEFGLTDENKTNSDLNSLEKLATDIQKENALKGERYKFFLIFKKYKAVYIR